MSEAALHRAVQDYAAAFKEAPPMIFAVVPERYDQLMRAMAQAVQRGRRLSERDVLRAAGLKAPPQQAGQVPTPMAAQPAPEDAPAS